MSTIDTIVRELEKIPEPLQLSVLDFIRSLGARDPVASQAAKATEKTTKNYPLHQLIIKTKNQYKIEEMVNPLLKYFNDNDYFNKQQKVHLENIREKIRLNDSLINQVDRLLNQLTAQKSNASISISEQSSIPTLFGKKDDLIKEKQVLKTVEVNYDRIIKDVSITNCIRFFDPIYLRLKVILPLLFVFLYLSGFWFINLVKSQKVRFDLEQKNN